MSCNLSYEAPVAHLASPDDSSTVEADGTSRVLKLMALPNESLCNEYAPRSPSLSTGNVPYSLRSVVTLSSMTSVSVMNEAVLPAPPVLSHVANSSRVQAVGFEVARNKRNADFHELFKTIPEGECLIEGAYVRALWRCMVLYWSFSLWLCPTTRDHRSRPRIHVGKSYLLPCRCLWMGQ